MMVLWVDSFQIQASFY